MKSISFKQYRYHLVPVSTRQVSLFEQTVSPEQLKEKKNDYLRALLIDMDNLRKGKISYPIKLVEHFDESYVFKVAVVRETTIYKNFEAETIENQPFVYVLINNDPKSQIILIEDNREVFNDTNTVKNILTVTLNLYLQDYHLVIHIEPIIEPIDFWKIINQHQNSIQWLRFNIVKPNLADISKSLKEPLRQLIDATNSHRTNINLQAPQTGVLENLTPNNQQLNDLVEYSNQGGGDAIKIKVKGLSKMISPKNKVKEVHVESFEASGDPQKVAEFWKGLLK